MMKIRSAVPCESVGMIAACAAVPNDARVIGAQPAAISSSARELRQAGAAVADAISDGVIRQFPARF